MRHARASVLDRPRSPSSGRIPHGPALLLALGFAAAPAAGARAAPPESPEAAARALFERGVLELQERRYAAALASFEESYGLAPRPVTLYNVGMCRHQLADPVGARRALVQYLAEAAPGDPPELAAGARAVLARLEALVRTVAVAVSEPGATVLLDSVEVGTSPLVAPLETTLGEHVLEARKDGFETVRAEFTVGEAELPPIELLLVAAAPPPPPPAPDASPGESVAPGPLEAVGPSPAPGAEMPPGDADTSHGVADAWFWTQVGLAVGAGAAAVATGSLALVYSSDYESAGVSNPGFRDDVIAYGLATDVLIAVAAASAGAALLLYFLREDEATGSGVPPPGVAAFGPAGLVVRW